MMIKRKLLASRLGYVGVCVVGFLSSAQAQQECSLATLAGNYGYTGAGTIIEGATPGPIAAVGRFTSDGQGHITGADTLSVNGEIRHRTYETVYEVNPDCTGSYEVHDSLGGVAHADFVIASGNEIQVIRTDDGGAITFTFRRQELTDCTEANWVGRFVYNGGGTIVTGPTAGPIAFVGHFVSDGAGSITGADTLSVNGNIRRRTYETRYEVNPDCTGSYEVIDSLGGVAHADFVIVDHGQEVRAMRTDPGGVITFDFIQPK